MIPFSDRLWHVAAALRRGISIDQIHQITGIDPWFLDNINTLINFEKKVIALNDITNLVDETLLNQANRQLREGDS